MQSGQLWMEELSFVGLTGAGWAANGLAEGGAVVRNGRSVPVSLGGRCGTRDAREVARGLRLTLRCFCADVAYGDDASMGHCAAVPVSPICFREHAGSLARCT